MKKEPKMIFNFDQDEELKIYKYALYDYVRNQKRAKKLKYKYTSFNDWKNNYVMKKYENITLNSLVDFHKYLRRRLENLMDKDAAASGFIYPILIMIIGLWVTYTADVIPNKTLGPIIAAALILYASNKVIKEIVNNDIAIKNLYRDYIEVIDELIQTKERQVSQDGAEGS